MKLLNQSSLVLCLSFMATNALASDCTETDLETLAATPYISPWDAYDGLVCLEEHLIAAGDRRAIFASVYRLTTQRVAESIDAGNYINTPWMRTYQTNFANRYRKALYDYERGSLNNVPDAWIVAFDAAVEGETLVLQDILLGMNAHINYDLPFAVEAVGMSPNQLQKYSDHTEVNDALGTVAGEIILALGSLYGSNYAAVDAAFGPVDDLILAVGMATARQNAWNNALALKNSFPWTRFVVVGWINSGALTTAGLALTPSLSPTLLATLRALEGTNPGSTFCQHFPCD